MAHKCEDYNNVCVLSLDGDLAGEANEIVRKLADERVDQRQIVDFVIDFEKAGFFDSEGLETLLWLKRRCEDLFGQLKLVNLDDNYLTSVRLGAEEIVCEGDPAKLGYLTVWAADYLARGHTFAPGSYDVGGPVGTVRYFSHNQELRLGQPLTITKANLAQYAGQPCPTGTPWPC